jgi:hypothetical protein
MRRATHALRAATRWERTAERLLKRLAAAEERAEHLQDRVREMLSEARRLIERHQDALESLRQENEILTETVVPQLTAANRMHLERWRAEVAVQVRRQVALTPENQEARE